VVPTAVGNNCAKIAGDQPTLRYESRRVDWRQLRMPSGSLMRRDFSGLIADTVPGNSICLNSSLRTAWALLVKQLVGPLDAVLTEMLGYWRSGDILRLFGKI